jgi:hypothetical protein
MNPLKLIPLAFLSLAACDVKPTNIKAESSSPVEFEIRTTGDSNAQLPEQIRVRFEQANAEKESLKVSKITTNEILLVSLENNIVSYGCDDKDPSVQTLPKKIEAAVVTLCGDLEVPQGISIHANQVILNDAHLTNTKASQSEVAIVYIATNELVVNGSNSLDLYRKQISKNVQSAPGAYFYLGEVSGDGTLEIYSEKTIIDSK